VNRSVTVIRGTNDKPAASNALAAVLTNQTSIGGELLIGYPIIGTPEGRYPIDALLVSPEAGIVVFDLIEGTNPGNFAEHQDDLANKLEARLRVHRELVERRALLIDLHSVSFAPAISDTSRYSDDEYPIANSETLLGVLKALTWSGYSKPVLDAALSAIQSISTIRKSRTRRSIANQNSRGAKLKRLEDSIATLDHLQSKAVVETVEGVQRIRGLAGSGKTIVLALKAAYLHAQHPDWRIAVTFNTRSLKAQFRSLITNFSVEQASVEPDWERLRILNAWGAPGGAERDGIYHEFCRTHGVDYLDFGTAKASFGNDAAFAGACEKALAEAKPDRPLYDAVLVDEAQDFPAQFLRLCYELLDDKKRLVYAYDELQNLSGASMAPPEELFGRNADGSPRVTFGEPQPGEPRRDVILEKCYRNSRPVLVTAHALGFGIYRKPPKNRSTGLVQIFDQARLWAEIGYRVKSGELRDGAYVELYRSEESSPRFLEMDSSPDDLVQFMQFESLEQQDEWVANAIKTNLHEDELRYDDFVVINPDPLTTRKRVGPIRRRLLDLGINSHLAGVDTDPDVFFQSNEQSITFTGVFRAKGNEAGMVYVVNAHDCASGWNLAVERNRLFTAITRSKAWVRVTGVGEGIRRLFDEYEQLRQRKFELHFTYPTKEQRDQLLVLHREMSVKERKLAQAREQQVQDLIRDLENGTMRPEDLDEDLREKLSELLSKKGT